MWVVDGLLHRCKKECVGCGWSIAAVQEGICGLWMVYCSGARRYMRVVDGLLQRCKKVYVGCGWSIAAVREEFP